MTGGTQGCGHREAAPWQSSAAAPHTATPKTHRCRLRSPRAHLQVARAVTPQYCFCTSGSSPLHPQIHTTTPPVCAILYSDPRNCTFTSSPGYPHSTPAVRLNPYQCNCKSSLLHPKIPPLQPQIPTTAPPVGTTSHANLHYPHQAPPWHIPIPTLATPTLHHCHPKPPAPLCTISHPYLPYSTFTSSLLHPHRTPRPPPSVHPHLHKAHPQILLIVPPGLQHCTQKHNSSIGPGGRRGGLDMGMTVHPTPHQGARPPSLAVPATRSRALHLQKQQLLMSGPLK